MPSFQSYGNKKTLIIQFLNFCQGHREVYIMKERRRNSFHKPYANRRFLFSFPLFLPSFPPFLPPFPFPLSSLFLSLSCFRELPCLKSELFNNNSPPSSPSSPSVLTERCSRKLTSHVHRCIWASGNILVSFTVPTIIQSGTLLIITIVPSASAAYNLGDFPNTFSKAQAAETSNLELCTGGAAKRLADDTRLRNTSLPLSQGPNPS